MGYQKNEVVENLPLEKCHSKVGYVSIGFGNRTKGENLHVEINMFKYVDVDVKLENPNSNIGGKGYPVTGAVATPDQQNRLLDIIYEITGVTEDYEDAIDE